MKSRQDAHGKELLVILAIFGLSVTLCASANGQIFLGPDSSMSVKGDVHWLAGAHGAGFSAVDYNDPDKKGYDLTMSNTVAGKENTADWRCPLFSLGPAAGGARPITFSFAYKLPDPVAVGDSIQVELRFFDASNNYISRGAILVGAHSHDSAMTNYRVQTINDILAPSKARMADIWITANIFKPWVSGAARFAHFSVTTVPRSRRFKMIVAAAVLLGLCALALLLVHFWRQTTARRAL